MALERVAITTGGPILLGILIGLGTLLKWPSFSINKIRTNFKYF